jgi:branched-subunit amino acid transport protein
MNFWLTVLGMLVVTFGSRLAGMMLTKELPPFWARFVRFVPVAVFTALIVPNLAGERGEWLPRVLGAVLCGVLAWRTKQLWVGLFVGMVAFWGLRSVLP